MRRSERANINFNTTGQCTLSLISTAGTHIYIAVFGKQSLPLSGVSVKEYMYAGRYLVVNNWKQ